MTFYLLGIDYNHVPLFVREEAYRRRRELEEYFRDKAPVLFTCNRTEVYGIAENGFEAEKEIHLAKEAFPLVFGSAYSEYETQEVVLHALRLATGLKSQLVGERQILKQLKAWISESAMHPDLERMWKKVMDEAEEIRMKTGLDSEYDISRIVMEDLTDKMHLKKRKTIVIVGTGKVAELFAESNNGKHDLYFVSRKNHSRARRLAKVSGGEVVKREDLFKVLKDADVLVSATRSPHYVIKKKDLIFIMKGRERPLHIYDLAVPRDIEHTAWDVKDLYLNDMDTLGEVFDRVNRRKLLNARKAYREIEEVKYSDAAYSGNASK